MELEMAFFWKEQWKGSLGGPFLLCLLNLSNLGTCLKGLDVFSHFSLFN